MSTLLAALQAVYSDDDGLTFAEVIANLPTDPASLFTLALLLTAVGVVLWTGRPRRPTPPKAPR